MQSKEMSYRDFILITNHICVVSYFFYMYRKEFQTILLRIDIIKC